jgi:hypothetical protein
MSPKRVPEESLDRGGGLSPPPAARRSHIKPTHPEKAAFAELLDGKLLVWSGGPPVSPLKSLPKRH